MNIIQFRGTNQANGYIFIFSGAIELETASAKRNQSKIIWMAWRSL